MKVFSTLEDLERILEMRGGAKTIDNLLMGRYRAAGPEQLKLNALLSVHPNLSDRILLRIVAINGERCFQVVAIALNHDYDKAIRSVEKILPIHQKMD